MPKLPKHKRHMYRMAELSVAVRKGRGMNKRRTGDQSDHVMPQAWAIPPPDLPYHFDDSDVSILSGSESEESISGDETDDDIDADKSDEDNGIDTTINEEDTPTSLVSLKWTSGAGDFLPNQYGHGCRMTTYRKKKDEEERHREASKHLSIKAIFQRQRDLNLSIAQGTVNQATTTVEPEREEREPSLSKMETTRQQRLDAATDLKRLIELPTEQTKKYGYILSKNGDFYRRHSLVLAFIWIQEHRDEYPGATRRDLAQMIARANNKGEKSARRIVQWENSWVAQRIIPKRKKQSNNSNYSWMHEEEICCAVRDFARSQGEGKGSRL
jgi:hypothetical protein